MINPFKKWNIITNFPKNYPLHKKIWANFIYLISGIVIHPRKNFLTKKDMLKTMLHLKKGDILLLGNLREYSATIIKSPLTHATIYIGHKKVIHALGNGITISPLHHLFTEYDTLAILRILKETKHKRKIIKQAITYAKNQLGKPYDFDFNKKHDSFFCTQLINDAYKSTSYNTNLKDIKKPKNISTKIKEEITGAINALEPTDFLKGNFKLIFLSHNLKLENKKLIFSENETPK